MIMSFNTRRYDVLIEQDPYWNIPAHNSIPLSSTNVKFLYERCRRLVHASGKITLDLHLFGARLTATRRDQNRRRSESYAKVLGVFPRPIHWNLCMGTIASFAKGRPDLRPLLEKLESFELCGQFMLTELGHGLDARNIETTATLLPSGNGFELHTPSVDASKAMPPTSPIGGIPKVAVVFAQLVVDGEKRGVRPFIVHLTTQGGMATGVSSRILPARPGARMVDHAITTFTHVILPREALLGDLERSDNERLQFLMQIQRVAVGTLSLSLTNQVSLKLASYITGKYSLRRMVSDNNSSKLVPIMSFASQHRPILSALAHGAVQYEAGLAAIRDFTNRNLGPFVSHGIACMYKSTAIEASQRLLTELSERCGWQGLMTFNRVIDSQLAQRGNSIAEGDVLVLCIRLASELLYKKYTLPEAKDPTCLLARHEAGLFAECRAKMAKFTNGARGAEYAAQILPRSRTLIQAIGQRYFYEAALASGRVRPELLSLYEAECISQDISWYTENAGMSREQIFDRYDIAVNQAFPMIETLIDDLALDKYADWTPLLSDENFQSFVQTLPVFRGGREDAWDRAQLGDSWSSLRRKQDGVFSYIEGPARSKPSHETRARAQL